MATILQALKLAAREHLCRWVMALSFALLLPLYAIILPASLTGGYLGWVSLRQLTPELVAIAAVMALLLSLTVALMALILRQGRRASASAAAGGAVVGLVTPLLCCSPILPLALGALAAVFPALAGAAPGHVQGFIATHEMGLLLAALALMGLALYQNARHAVQGLLPRSKAHRGAATPKWYVATNLRLVLRGVHRVRSMA